MGNLCRCVAAETYALHPPYLCQQPGYFRRNQASVESLIEIHVILSADNLLNLCQPVTAGKYVVVHENQVVSTSHGNIVHIHVRAYAALLLRNDAPTAMVGTSARKKSVCRIVRNAGIERIIGLQAVHLFGQDGMNVIACATSDHLADIGDVISVVWREREDLGHV